jgi:hypothetical protein
MNSEATPIPNRNSWLKTANSEAVLRRETALRDSSLIDPITGRPPRVRRYLQSKIDLPE